MWNRENRMQFHACIADLIDHPDVRFMETIPQHSSATCLDHSIFVAYISFLICRFFGWNFVAAARGGLLHDLFLYNWREKNSHQGLHGFSHPKTALKNASARFSINFIEADIIVKHMWPLTIRFPKYRESYVVSFADKFCAIVELLHLARRINVRHKLQIALQPVFHPALQP